MSFVQGKNPDWPTMPRMEDFVAIPCRRKSRSYWLASFVRLQFSFFISEPARSGYGWNWSDSWGTDADCFASARGSEQLYPSLTDHDTTSFVGWSRPSGYTRRHLWWPCSHHWIHCGEHHNNRKKRHRTLRIRMIWKPAKIRLGYIFHELVVLYL